LPEFLCCRNGVDFGTKQNLEKVGDVELPPWATTAEEFVRINRMALESEYVSNHLHEWIDLIFGDKQRGPEGVKSLNMFYYLTYEGTVDIDAVDDPITRDSIIAQIENFGQTPLQLFKKPHPRRTMIQVPVPVISTLQILMVRPIAMQPIIHLKVLQQYNTMGERESLITALPFFNTSYGVSVLSRLAVVTSDGLVYVGKINAASLSQGQMEAMSAKSVGFPILSNHFNMMTTSFINSPNTDEQNKQVQYPAYSQIIAIPSTPVPSNNKDISVYSAHHWDNSFRLSKPFVNNQFNERKVVLCQEKSIMRHKDLVTCCALCENDRILVTGSRDTTVMVWATQSFELSNPQPLQILYGHDDEITCVAVSHDLDVVVSGSKDCSVIVHTLSDGAYVRTIKHPQQECIDLLAFAARAEVDSIADSLGNIVMYSKNDMTLYLFSLNGKLLHHIDTSEVLHVLKIHDCKYVIYAGEKGYIFIRKLNDLSSVVCRYNCKEFGSPIRSVDLSQDEKFLFVGLQDGRLIVFGQREKKD
jgi:hypothetical protein